MLCSQSNQTIMKKNTAKGVIQKPHKQSRDVQLKDCDLDFKTHAILFINACFY